MDQFPDDYKFSDALKDWPRILQALRFTEQLRNIDVIQHGGTIKRIHVTPKSLNAVLDLRDIQSVVSALPRPPVLDTELCPETTIWRSRAIAAGGTFLSDSVSICHGLCKEIATREYKPKLVALWPLLGGNLATARVPLIDTLGVGQALNNGFLDADFSQSTGLQGSVSNKYFISQIRPSQLSLSGNGGLGWWELNVSTSGVVNVEPIGAYKLNNSPDNRFSLDVREEAQAFIWGTTGSGAGISGAPQSKHFYGQSRDGIRQLNLGGSLVASSSAATSTDGLSDSVIIISGCNTGGGGGIRSWGGRGGAAYVTDGTMSANEIADFHTLLLNHLMIPTRRVPGEVGVTYPAPGEPVSECEVCINSISTDRNTGAVSVDRNTGNVSMARA